MDGWMADWVAPGWGWVACDVCGEPQLVKITREGKPKSEARCMLTPGCKGKLVKVVKV